MMLPPSQNIVELEDISEEEELKIFQYIYFITLNRDVNLKSTSLFQHRHFKSPFDRIKKKRKIDSSELKRNRSQSEYIHSFSILSFLEKEYKKNKH